MNDYEKSLIEDNGVSLFYKYKFKEFEYQNSQIGRTLFPNMSFNNNNFSSGNIGDIFIQYPELERITIEFKTDKYVTFNNANKVENDIYYWYIDRTNYSRKNIKINLSDQDNRNVLEKIQEKTNEINDEEIDDFINYIFILLGAVLVIIIIIVFVKIKNSNKK